MNHFIRLCICGLVAIQLSACQPQITLKTVTLNPSNVSWGYQSNYYTSWECSVPLPGQAFFLNGLGPETVNPGEAPSGFDDIYNKGADPLPCEEKEQILYRGDVQFDLSKFAAIVSATLNFNGIRSTQNYNAQTPPACVATILGFATAPSMGSNGPYFWNYSDSIDMQPSNPCQTLIPPLFSFDVSSWTRQWTGGQVANNGMIIAGPDLGAPIQPTDNNGNVSFYSGFQLTVIYNPALNPAAPQ